MKHSLRLLLAVLAGISCAREASAQWPHINDKLKAKSVAIRKVVILPAEVSFFRQGVKGSENMATEAARIGQSVYAAVLAELGVRGVEVLPDPSKAVKDDAARYAIADLQAKYDNIAVQVRKKPGRVEKGRFTLGDRVARFEPGASADALVFIRGAGFVPTAGKKALSVAAWSWAGALAQFRGEVVFVDAKTGEVLAFVRFNRFENMAENSEERSSRRIREALHDIPLPSPPPKS